MKWTRTPPTKPGWYWLRWNGDGNDRGEERTEIVTVADWDYLPGQIAVYEPTCEVARPLGVYNGFWAGPLAPPEENAS